MLKLGYKASAEQFAPSKLLAFSVLAEQVGIQLGVHQRPFPALEAHRRTCPQCAGLARRARRGDTAGRDRHIRADTDVPLRSSVVAQAFGTLGAMFPGRVVLGVGTGEGLNEAPSTGWCGRDQGSASPVSARPTNSSANCGARTASASRARTTGPRTYHLRQAGPVVPIYVAGAGPQVAKYAGRSAQGSSAHRARRGSSTPRPWPPNVEEG